MARELKDLLTTDLLLIVSRPDSEKQFAEAVAELINRYKRVVYKQSLAISGGDRTLADDIFQETFIRLITWLPSNWPKLTVHSFPRLLSTFARRTAIDLIRKVSKQLPSLLAMEENAHRDIDLSFYVVELLQTLDQTSKDVLRLTFFEDLSATETAKRLNMSPGNVRLIKFRALEKIRQAMAMDDLAETMEPL